MRILGQSRYLETREAIMELLRTKQFPKNKLDSEEELSRQLGISVPTIREALRELDREGYITKKHGSGNYVHKSAFTAQMRIDMTRDYGQLLQERYGDVQTVQMPYRVVQMDELQAGRLHCPVGEEALEYVRHFVVRGDRVAILAINCIPMKRVQRDLKELKEPFSIMDFLWENCAEEMVQNIVRIGACSCEGGQAEILNVPEGTPLICWEETFFNLDDEPVGFTRSYFHPELVDMHLLMKRR